MSDEQSPPGLRPILQRTARSSHPGGTHTHKPGCACRPCKARTRQQEALSGGDGGEVVPEPPLEVDGALVEYATRSRYGGRKSGRSREVVSEWIKQRSLNPDITNTEIARRLGIARQTLGANIRKAVKEGWLVFDDPLERIEHQIIPKTIDNLNKFLDERDKTVSIEIAKGAIFPLYRASKGVADSAQTVLALKIEMPDGDRIPGSIEGSVVGSPKVVEDASEHS